MEELHGEHYPIDGSVQPQYRYAVHWPYDIADLSVEEIIAAHVTLANDAETIVDPAIVWVDGSPLGFDMDAGMRLDGLEEKIDFLPYVDLSKARDLLEALAASSHERQRHVAGTQLACELLCAATRIPDDAERQQWIEKTTATWTQLVRDPELHIMAHDAFYRRLLYDERGIGAPDKITLRDVRDVMLAMQARNLVGKSASPQLMISDPELARVELGEAARSTDPEQRRNAAVGLVHLLQLDTRIEDPAVREQHIWDTISTLSNLINRLDSDDARELAHASFHFDLLSDPVASSRITLADASQLLERLDP